MKAQTAIEPETGHPQPQLPATLNRIVLTGFMGAGKTTVGRLLASRLGWTFLDLDHLLESRTGLTVPQIFAQQGEAAFRRLESTALAHALGQHHTVLALGGGAIESQTNRLLLEQTPGTLTIFLDAPFPVLFDRCMLEELNPRVPGAEGQSGIPSRPVLADPAQAEARFAARQPHYRRLANIVLDTARLAPPAAADELIGLLAQQSASH